jgi:hypothetical protein
MTRIINLSLMAILCVLLSACNEQWMRDNRPIAKNDFAMIQLETDNCRNAAWEQSCLQHLKMRIE